MTRMSALLLPALALAAGIASSVQAQSPAQTEARNPAQTEARNPAQDPAPSRGDALCGERARIVERLRAAYGETRRGYGLQRGTSVVEVYASDKTGSWTILTTSASGIACLVASGENWAPETLVAGDPA